MKERKKALKALSEPKNAASLRIAVFDHALPYQILLEELQAQGISRQQDVEAVAQAKETCVQLKEAKDALDDWSTKRSGLPLPARGSQQEREQNEALLKVREAEWSCKTRKEGVTDALHHANRSALCFSGGGIRSASICLGVLQGLARFSMRDPAGHPGMLHK